MRAINLNKTWQHRRSLLAGFSATILAMVFVGCVASTGNTRLENKTSPESTSIATAQNSLGGVADKTLNQSQQSTAVESKSITQSEQSSKQGDVPEFTTEGKPTKTIETPWGPREVFDPTQVPEVREFFALWYKKPIPIIEFPQEMIDVVKKSSRIQALDYARHQCMRQTYHGGCREEDFVFKNFCSINSNFHSIEFSKCESENHVALWRSRGKCTPDLSGFTPYLRSLAELPYEEALKTHFSRECVVWRGQHGSNYWEKDRVNGEIPRPR